MSYIELRCHSAFSFLYGASEPETLVAAAAELGYPALALTDRDGLYGAPRFYQAARKRGLHAIVGVDLQLRDSGRVLLLVESAAGYRRLCRMISRAHLRQRRQPATGWEIEEAHGAPFAGITLDDLDDAAGLLALWRGRDLTELDRLQAAFPGALYLELQRHALREEEHHNRWLLALAAQRRLPVVATNGVRYATPHDADLCDAMSCIAAKVPLDGAGRLVAENRERYLKSAAAMQALFADRPEAIARSLEIAGRCRYSLGELGYRFPHYKGMTLRDQQALLCTLAEEGATRRYRPPTPKVRAQLARELELIGKLELPGYFLAVWDLVEECRRRGILVQGRGSAANSAVCYALGITAVDPIGLELLFERFLSEDRGEWPDIDLDLPSGDRREAMIQYVYQSYAKVPSLDAAIAAGPGCAMTANCITYRMRSAVRDLAKVLGVAGEGTERLGQLLSPYEFRAPEDSVERNVEAAGLDATDARTALLLRLCRQIEGLPRHLGQHSGGMVLSATRLDELCPVEPAAMEGRVVITWDKDDCAQLGLIKVDLLGLGMMAVLEDAIPIIRAHHGVNVDYAQLPPNDPAIYGMLQRADTVGLFQVESRAQMNTLPRMKPERFYDLVVEVAIIRPGPIIGKMVHPYLNRRQGREAVRYPHPALEPILKRTLGVPLFQEQVMRLAMEAAGFSGSEAEELRRAMGSKRSEARMRAMEDRLHEGMRARGYGESVQREVIDAIRSFALYGFPESHAASFALLVYASAYLKAHFPAAFLAALLNNWPMGFYHPATLIQDARRHGVRVLPIDVLRSDWLATLEGGAVRLGFRLVAGLREKSAQAICLARQHVQTIEAIWQQSGASRAEIATLASIGAFASLGLHRRAALWRADALGQSGRALFAAVPSDEAAPIAAMSDGERLAADYRGTGVTVGAHPMARLRGALRARRVSSAVELAERRDGERVQIAGSVIVRQRPGSAKGFFFVTLEDETGFTNAIVTPAIFAANRRVLSLAPALVIEGILQHQDGVVAVKADRFTALDETLKTPSRDFH